MGYVLHLWPLLVVAAAVERAAQRVVVSHGHALRRVVLDQAEVGLGGVRSERAVGLTLEEHRRRQAVVRVRVGVRGRVRVGVRVREFHGAMSSTCSCCLARRAACMVKGGDIGGFGGG